MDAMMLIVKMIKLYTLIILLVFLIKNLEFYKGYVIVGFIQLPCWIVSYCFSSLNSLDMNEVGDSAVFVDPFDEQEIALDFIEDPANETSYTFQDISKTFLDNVIKEREAEMNKKNQNSESMSGHTNMALSVTSLETTDV